MGQNEWWPWRLVTGNAMQSGVVLVVLSLAAGYYSGMAPLTLGLAGAASMLLISGFLLTRYGLGLLTGGVCLLVWLGVLTVPFQLAVPVELPRELAWGLSGLFSARA